MKHKVNEIFYSIQGEGIWTGTPCIFIRFSGCNLNCSFCDTSHASFIEMDENEIMKEVKKYPSRHVIITGGEPTLQFTELNLSHLFPMLKVERRYIHLETNGTIVEFYYSGLIDWVTISPKENWKLKKGDELKVIYIGQNLEQYFEHTNFRHYYLQPCDGMNNVEEVVNIVKGDVRWKLSLQTHKMINIK